MRKFLLSIFIKLGSIFPVLILCFGICSHTFAKDLTESPEPFADKNMSVPKDLPPSDVPNTIKGLMENGREGDFALLRGFFVKKLDENSFSFMDDNHDVLNVILIDQKLQTEIYANQRYFIWGRIASVSKNEAVFNIVSLKMVPDSVKLP